MKKTQNIKRLPSKPTLNMAMREKSSLSPARLIPALVLLLAVIGLFAKFAVIDRFQSVRQAELELQSIQAQSRQLAEELEDYDRIKERYDRYSNTYIPQEALALQTRSHILGIMEQYLMPAAKVRNVSISNNLMSIELEGITLDGMSLVVQVLNTLPDVTNVEVYTVTDGGPNGQRPPTVSMLLALRNTIDITAEGGEG